MTENYGDHLFIPIADKCLASGADDELIPCSKCLHSEGWIHCARTYANTL